MAQQVTIMWAVTETHRLTVSVEDFRAAFNVPEGTIITSESATDAIGENIDEMAYAEDGNTWVSTDERDLISVVVKS
jgi:hypothetical protein